MIYVTCDLVEGNTRVADEEELSEFAWLKHSELPRYVPYGLFEPVQAHLDSVLAD
jgi:8-oxo-dGTP diphosphatase